MPKDILRVDTDITEMMGFLGAVSQMEETIKSARYKSAILDYAHGKLSDSFNSYADAIAGSTDSFSHMYEWKMRGNPMGRLWRHKLAGRAGNKSATFVFLASRKPIPTPEERSSDSNDPISRVDPDDLARLSKRRYYFYWKAPIAEYNLQVKIVPKHAKKLFMPLDGVPKNFVFVNVINQNGVSPKFVGRFTGLWTQWWSSVAPGEFERFVKESLQDDLREPVISVMASSKKSRTVSLSAVTDNEAAFRAGKAIAEQILERKISTYSKAKKIVIEEYWKNG